MTLAQLPRAESTEAWPGKSYLANNTSRSLCVAEGVGDRRVFLYFALLFFI